jgi:anti-anti-sigma factor
MQSGTGSFRLNSSRAGQRLSIRVHGDLNANSAHHLEETLLHMAAPRGEILIELSEVSLMDTAGLEALIRSKCHADSIGARITLRSMPARFRELLERCGLSSAFSYADERRDPESSEHLVARSP